MGGTGFLPGSDFSVKWLEVFSPFKIQRKKLRRWYSCYPQTQVSEVIEC
jgi:hypothetical protein